jgi:predicted nucleic acid-binding Zn ribbon protein
MGSRDEGKGRAATRGKSREPEAMQSALQRALGSLDLERARSSWDIGEHWRAIVGEEVARHCRPVGVRAGVLYAEVESSAWCQQLQLRTPEILRALRGSMGEKAPKELRFRVGYNPPP